MTPTPVSNPMPEIVSSPVSPVNSPAWKRDRGVILGVWLALTIMVLLMARENLSVPGLYYDESMYGGMAKDFLAGDQHRGWHAPGTTVVHIFGRPFPVFIAGYLGALKCWLFLPAFSLFGCSAPVLRLTSLACGLFALLLFMLWVGRWLGKNAALIAGTILALDPTFFFSSLIDWGSFTPSLLARCACFYLVCLWWQHGRKQHAVLAGMFAGLGFFNKVDFAILLFGALVAAICAYRSELLVRLRAELGTLTAACIGFLLTAGLMLFHLSQVLHASGGVQGSLTNKLHTLMQMYDGSYYYRLIDVGGVFPLMCGHATDVFSPFGGAVVLAILLACVIWRSIPDSHQRAALFLLVATALITIGVLILPGAVRLHHTVLVFPFPHLVAGFVLTLVWRRFPTSQVTHRLVRVALSVSLIVLVFCQVLAIRKTQHLICETGGRGWWSDSLGRFLREVDGRADLTIFSLDWGFNEQVLFLTDGPRVGEPFWLFPNLTLNDFPKSTNYIFLVHPPQYTLAPCGTKFLDAAGRQRGMEIRPYYDRQTNISFYAIRFQAPPDQPIPATNHPAIGSPGP